ncbi:hypothetical protein QQF64_009342 [Cirrhinus molitorella]|uniref:Uncharacterized protein n=1 Tax=Cirrhinus molitorella TaxID=172907 RepID=A0ABR3M1T2_9TELE
MSFVLFSGQGPSAPRGFPASLLKTPTLPSYSRLWLQRMPTEALAELTPVRWDVVNAPGVRLARGEPLSPNIPGGSSASSENVNGADEKRPHDLHTVEMPACVSERGDANQKKSVVFLRDTGLY